jgi:hypothetical protein
MAFLASETFDFFNRHALYARFGQRFFDFIQLEGLHNRFDHLHRDSFDWDPIGKTAFAWISRTCQQQAQCHEICSLTKVAWQCEMVTEFQKT